jgi:hypothetical protein
LTDTINIKNIPYNLGQNVRYKSDRLLTYCHEYYVPFNGSIAQASLSLAYYRVHPSPENRFKAFYYYCQYLYHENRMFTAGVPFPFEKKQCDKFIDRVQATLKLPGLSDLQHQECITALTPLNVYSVMPENFEDIKRTLQGRLPHEAALEEGNLWGQAFGYVFSRIF